MPETTEPAPIQINPSVGIEKPNGAPKPEVPPEAPVEPKPEPTPEQKASASRFAALVRKERQANEIRRQAKAEKEEAQRLRTENEKIGQFLANAKKQPLKALEALGLSYESVTNAQLNDGMPGPELQISAVRDEFENYKKQQAEEKLKIAQELKDAQSAQHKQVLSDFRADVTAFVKGKADEYELINLYGSHDLVASVIEQNHAQTGKLLTNSEAAAKVEKFLEDQARKVISAKKFQSKPAPTPERKQAVSSTPRSLSNDMSASSSSYDSQAKSWKEREQRALAALSK